VEQQNFGVSKAARKLKIKIATAKVILRAYRQEGKIFKKKGDKPRP
jgi:transposase